MTLFYSGGQAGYNTLYGLGYRGSINEMVRNFFIDQGASGSTLNELAMDWLLDKGFTNPEFNDRWYAYLKSLGYTGSINDMAYAAGVDGTLYSTSADALLLEDGFYLLLEDGFKLLLE